MKTDKHIIVSAINLYFDGLSLRKTQRNLKQIFGETVSQVTILNWIKKYSLRAHGPLLCSGTRIWIKPQAISKHLKLHCGAIKK